MSEQSATIVGPIKPRLSVVIATRNRAQQLSRALQSLAAQSVSAQHFDVIVVDNGSSDGSLSSAQSYRNRFPHWRILQESKPGAAAARNAGIRESRAPIILFLDDDVIADRELIAEHLESHSKHPNVAVLGGVRFPWKGAESPFFWCLNRHPELFQSFNFSDPNNVPFQYFYTCNLSMGRTFFDQGQLFDESFTASGFEDTDLGYRFTSTGFRVIFNASALVCHGIRVNSKQFSSKRYASGRWAGHFLQKYPHLKPIFIAPGFKAKLSNAIGFCVTPLHKLFDLPESMLNRRLQPILGILCWHHLQYCFQKGFRASVECDLQENRQITSMK